MRMKHCASLIMSWTSEPGLAIFHSERWSRQDNLKVTYKYLRRHPVRDRLSGCIARPESIYRWAETAKFCAVLVKTFHICLWCMCVVYTLSFMVGIVRFESCASTLLCWRSWTQNKRNTNNNKNNGNKNSCPDITQRVAHIVSYLNLIEVLACTLFFLLN